MDYALKFDHVDSGPSTAGIPIKSRTDDPGAQGRSPKRRESKDFEKVDKNIARYNEQKKAQAHSLNEEKFLAERAELNADKEEEKEIEEINDPNRPVVRHEELLHRGSPGGHDRLFRAF